MEFFDTKRQKAHRNRLFIGYILIGLIIILTTLILLYWARGYGLKNGEVIQSGRVFVSSRPSNAEILINGARHGDNTNTSILMEAGQYTFELKRNGYRPWKRAINVEGGSVSRFDYPVLFPEKLTSTTVKQYDTAPSLYLHSPDRRWLLIQHGSGLSFDVFDLDNREDLPKQIAIPNGIVSSQDGSKWESVEWSTDNRHILLRHSYQKDTQTVTEYILFDREEPGKSVNLTRIFGMNVGHIELRHKKYDQYYLYDKPGLKLYTASLKDPAPALLLDNILAFKSHGENRILYVTAESQPADKASVRLREGDVTYTLRQVPRADHYLLDLAEYERDWFVVIGNPAESRTYIYKNPVASLKAAPARPLVPVHIFKQTQPSFLAFSDTARFVAVQSGTSFAVFDAENEKAYAFQLKTPIDDPQQHAVWMDGHRLSAVSNGKLIAFDFDNANQEVLVETDPNIGSFFDRQYRFLYTVTNQVAKNPDGQEVARRVLQRTPLLTSEDQ